MVSEVLYKLPREQRNEKFLPTTKLINHTNYKHDKIHAKVQ